MSISEKQGDLSNTPGIESLAPDLVLAVDILDKKNSQINLSKLVDKLIKGGFYVQVRPGLGVSKLIVFIKLSNKDLTRIVKDSEITDFIYGVNNDLFENCNDGIKIDEANKLRIIYNYLTNDENESLSSLGITPKLGDWEFVDSIQPIHNVEANQELIKKWKRTFKITDEDVEFIKDQYGTQIAFYFAFLKTYLKWLTFPALIGAVNFFVLKKQFSLIYTFLNLIWAIFFVQTWYASERYYSLKWNVKNLTSSSITQTSNLKFTPSKLVSNFSSFLDIKTFKYYPSYKRFLTKLSFFPILIVFSIILIVWQFFCFLIEIFITEFYDGPFSLILSLVLTILSSVFVIVFTQIYKVFASKFVGFENQRTNLNLEISLNEKFFMVGFLTSYLALFITSFVYFPFGFKINNYVGHIVSFVQDNVYNEFPIKKDVFFRINATRMSGQFYFAMVTNQIIGFFLEYGLPFILRQINKIIESFKKDTIVYEYNDDKSEKKYLEQIRNQVFELDVYDVNDDIKQMVFQFGYLVFFSQCWTIAPLICFIVSYLQFFGDSAKIFLEQKRPIPLRTNLIYPWNQFLGILVWLSSLIAPAISSMYNSSDVVLGKIKRDGAQEHFTKSSVSIETWSLLAIVIFSEHLYLILNYVLGIFYSKVDSKESEKDFKATLEVKKSLIKESGFLSPTKTSPLVTSDKDSTEYNWQIYKSNNPEHVVRSAQLMIENVKPSIVDSKSTKTSTVQKTVVETPQVKTSTSAATRKPETIEEKPGSTGVFQSQGAYQRKAST